MTKKIIKEPEDMVLPGASPSEGNANPRDKDTAPSRTGKGTGEGNKAQDVVTTRQDQIKKV